MTKRIGEFLVLGVFAAILIASFASAVGEDNCTTTRTTMRTAHDYCNTGDVTVVNGVLTRGWHTGTYCSSASSGYCKCYGSAYATAPAGYIYNSSTMDARCSITATTANDVSFQCRLDGKALYSVNNTWCAGCTPNCADKQCGDDGCGGTCGTCASGNTCNSTGQCVSGGGTCTDSDSGKNYTVKGTFSGLWNGQQITNTDSCVDSLDESGDDVPSSDYLGEGYCENGLLQIERITCPRGCRDGACIPTVDNVKTCVNVTTRMSTSDDECGDRDISVVDGTLIAGSAKHECIPVPYGNDYICGGYKCWASASQNYSDYVLNQIINDRGCATNVASNSFRCRLDNGAKSVTLEWCSSTSLECNDSDGGKNYSVKGTACIGTKCEEDSCNESNPNLLKEVYIEEEGFISDTSCSNLADIFVEEYECPEGCSDGACVGCVPEWECAVSPPVCPQSGIQTKKCKDSNGCVNDTFENVTCTPGVCSGCVDEANNGRCIPFGFRVISEGTPGTPSYCDLDGVMKAQKTRDAQGNWAKCQNSYECESNACSSGECIEVQSMLNQAGAIKGLAIRVLCRFANLFKEDNYASCIAKYVGVQLE